MKKYLHLLILLGFTAVLGACGDDTPPVAVTIAEICQQESGTKVITEGYLALPSFLICEKSQCKVNFHDETSNVLVELVASNKPGTNNLQLPPEQYTAADLSFVLADGTTGDGTTRVKLTGPVRRPSANVCYLDAHAIEQP